MRANILPITFDKGSFTNYVCNFGLFWGTGYDGTEGLWNLSDTTVLNFLERYLWFFFDFEKGSMKYIQYEHHQEGKTFPPMHGVTNFSEIGTK